MTSPLLSGEELTRPRSPGRPDETFARARRHSRRVAWLKVGIPAIALLLIVIFAAWAWLGAPAGFSADIAGSAFRDGKLVMANPKLNGFTGDNRPYSMTAAKAVQDLAETNLIMLEDIRATLPVEDDNWAEIAASSGIFDNEKNILDVDSEMTIRTAGGLEAFLNSAHVDVGAGLVSTTKPVDIRLNGATVAADSMSVTERGSVIVFENRVRMTIIPEKIADTDGRTE